MITGASSGLGADLARQLAARGDDLALCARRLDRLDALAEELRTAFPERRVVVQVMDVTDDDQVVAGFAAVHAELGPIDRVVINAGQSGGAALGTGGHDRNRATTMINYVGALAQADAALAIFRAQGRGHLVFVGSMAALRGLPGPMAAYSATKTALAQLADRLRTELQGSAIAVTVLHPGYVATEMNPDARPGPFMSSSPAAARAMVTAIERRRRSAIVPPWPWAPLSVVLRTIPAPLLRRILAQTG